MLINEYQEHQASGYCEKCGRLPYSTSYALFKDEFSTKRKQLRELMPSIPVVTAQSPQNWQYDTISLVTAQSVLGTGLVSEISSGFSDLFGTNSQTLTSKLKNGENFCLDMLRKEALQLGANAIIAVDVDYSEVGGSKAMLMVCMSGTAVKLRNTEILGETQGKNIVNAIELTNRINYLLQFADLHYTL
jgi:uncharacterized protein YbjQ (UPF0145 family)